jgi:hypothetical protein
MVQKGGQKERRENAIRDTDGVLGQSADDQNL